MITYKLLKDMGRQRLYKLSEKISVGRDGNDIQFDNKPFETMYVIISDAHTHLERLAFPARLINCESEQQAIDYLEKYSPLPTAARFKNKEDETKPYVEIDYLDIGGNIGWLIEGYSETNQNLIMTDEQILNQIIEANVELIQ